MHISKFRVFSFFLNIYNVFLINFNEIDIILDYISCWKSDFFALLIMWLVFFGVNVFFCSVFFSSLNAANHIFHLFQFFSLFLFLSLHSYSYSQQTLLSSFYFSVFCCNLSFSLSSFSFSRFIYILYIYIVFEGYFMLIYICFFLFAILYLELHECNLIRFLQFFSFYVFLLLQFLSLSLSFGCLFSSLTMRNLLRLLLRANLILA